MDSPIQGIIVSKATAETLAGQAFLDKCERDGLPISFREEVNLEELPKARAGVNAETAERSAIAIDAHCKELAINAKVSTYPEAQGYGVQVTFFQVPSTENLQAVFTRIGGTTNLRIELRSAAEDSPRVHILDCQRVPAYNTLFSNPLDGLMKYGGKVVYRVTADDQLEVGLGYANDQHVMIALRSFGEGWKAASKEYGGGDIKLADNGNEIEIDGYSLSLDSKAISEAHKPAIIEAIRKEIRHRREELN